MGKICMAVCLDNFCCLLPCVSNLYPSVEDEDVSTSAVHGTGGEKSGGIDVPGNIDDVKAGCTVGKVDAGKVGCTGGDTSGIITGGILGRTVGNTGGNITGGKVGRTGGDIGGNIAGGIL